MSVSSRDDILLNSRPLIKYSEISNKEFIIEDFQNKVLRPILKFQNDLFVQLFIKQLKSKKQLFKTFELEVKRKVINENFKRNSSLKQLLLGSVIGLFTCEEIKVYNEFTSVINKRIFSMLKKRLEDQLLKI